LVFRENIPAIKLFQASVTAELAVGFGRLVRNMIDTDAYREIFPGLHYELIVKLLVDGQPIKVVNILRLGFQEVVPGLGVT